MKKDYFREYLEGFVKLFTKPVFILGILGWVGLFAFFFVNSLFGFKTGNVISQAEYLGGLSGAQFFVILFVLLSVLLFLVWKYVVQRGTPPLLNFPKVAIGIGQSGRG